MPFDGTGFFGKPASRLDRWLALCSSAAATLGRLFRARRFNRSSESIDAAVLRVLEEARGLIAQREDWTQRTLETIRGQRCAVGALRLSADLLNYPEAGRLARGLLTDVAVERGYSTIEAMNDCSRHEQVISAFDTAIAAAKR